MNIDSLAQALFGSKRAETQEVSTDGTTRTYTGVALTDSEDGTVVIDLGGDVTLPDDLYDEDGNVVAEWDGVGVEMPTSPQVSAGDDVIVTLMGGSSTKMPMVTSSAGSGDRMRTLVGAAQAVADAAQAVAEAVNQHFFADTNGAHVTQATQDEWEQEQSGPNSLWNSLGMLFRDGLNNLLAIVTNGIAIYDGNGNEDGNILAKFYTFVRNDNQHARVDFFNGKGFIDYDSALNTLQVSARDDSTASVSMNTARINLYQSVDNNTSNLELLAGANYGAPPAFIQLDSRYDDGPESDPTVSPYKSTIYTYASDLLLGYYGDGGSTTIPMQQAIVSLRSPVGTYTSSNTTSTASASGWQLTWFNVVVAEHGTPRTYDYTFSNGVLTAQRDCVLEISGVMNWTDSVQGNRGFGIFEGTTVGSGTEASSFQNFPSGVSNRKSVVFPPKVFTLTAGSSLTFGRYQQANAVYQNGTNYSWVTIRVVG